MLIDKFSVLSSEAVQVIDEGSPTAGSTQWFRDDINTFEKGCSIMEKTLRTGVFEELKHDDMMFVTGGAPNFFVGLLVGWAIEGVVKEITGKSPSELLFSGPSYHYPGVSSLK